MKNIPILFLITFLFSCNQSNKENNSQIKYFPLETGSYWIYSGTIETTINTSLIQKEIIWKMEVIETIRRGEITGYSMKGYPSDLSWYKDDQAPSIYSIIQIGDNKFYKSGIETYERIENQADNLDNLVEERQLIFIFPLSKVNKYCPTEDINRSDSWYCWIVGKDTESINWEIIGLQEDNSLMPYSLTFMTGPDRESIQFVEGLGITKYIYSHHGTISNVYVKLVEYHAGIK